MMILQNKKGATEWTIGKLMTIILAVVLLALIVYGVSSGAINPLVERTKGMFDSVLIMLNLKEDVGGGGSIVTAEIYGIKDVEVTITEDWCRVNLDSRAGSFSGVYIVEFENSKWVFKEWTKDKDGDEFWYNIDFKTATEKKKFEREVYQFLEDKRWNLWFYSTSKSEYYKMWLGDNGLSTHFWFEEGGDSYAFGKNRYLGYPYQYVCLWAVGDKTTEYTCSDLEDNKKYPVQYQIYHDLKNSLPYNDKNLFEFKGKKYKLKLLLSNEEVSSFGDLEGRLLQFEPENSDGSKTFYGIDNNGNFYIQKEGDIRKWESVSKKEWGEYWHVYIPEEAEGEDWGNFLERGKIREDLLKACGVNDE